MSESPTNRIHCNTCRQSTRHDLKAKQIRELELEFDGALREWIEFRFWVCRGCETATMEAAYADDAIDLEGGEKFWGSQFYPKRAAADLSPKKFQKLDKKLSSIYREIIKAYNGGIPLLCSGGLRALLEGVCASKGIKGKTLEEKIEGLQRVLPKNIVTNLHSFRFIGNKAMHELNPPSPDNLRLAIEVIEDLLNFLYELDDKTSQLAQNNLVRPAKLATSSKDIVSTIPGNS